MKLTETTVRIITSKYRDISLLELTWFMNTRLTKNLLASF